MASSEPARTARPRIPPRRRRALAGTALALLLATTACTAARHRSDDKGGGSDYPSTFGSPLQGQDSSTALSTDGWPQHGQAAYVLGTGKPAASPNQKPAPIASVAKVMTAYLVLKHNPLHSGDSGPLFTIGQSDVADTVTRRGQGQSVVDVRAGEQLSERDALMAILLPSANNIAVLVARQVDGGVASFVTEMNRTAQELGMSHTTYTDPSGFDPGTVSTAADQLRLAQVVAGDKTLAEVMATSSYSLPVAGPVTNTDALLGQDGFVGMKTGSDGAAGGCFMFRSLRHTDHGDVTLIGVVLGQPGPDLIGAGLNAARELADRVAPNIGTSGSSSAATSGRTSRPVPPNAPPKTGGIRP